MTSFKKLQIMSSWKIKTAHPDSPPGFPFAIVGFRDEVVAWVKNKKDAETIKKAAGRISSLESDATRNKRLWMGRMAQRS